MRLFNFVILFLAFIFSGVPVASFFVSAGQNVTIAPYSNTTLICAVYDAGNASMPFSFSWEQSKGPAVADLFGKYTEAVFVLVSSEGEYGFQVQVTDRRGNAASAVVYVIVSSSIPELPATTTPVNDDNSSDSGFLGSTVFWISMGGASLLLFLVVFVIIFCFFSRRAQNIPSHASTSRKSTSLKSSAELKRYEPLEDDRDAGVHVDTSPFNRASLSPGLASNTKDNVQRGTSSIPLPSKPQTGISPPKPPLKPGSIHF